MADWEHPYRFMRYARNGYRARLSIATALFDYGVREISRLATKKFVEQALAVILDVY